MPKSILNNPTAYAYVHPAVAQIQFKALGHPIGRPITLFAYTNQWAATVGMLTPFAIITAIHARSSVVKNLVIALIVIAAIPIVVSINRGLWIALIVAGIYIGVRLALSGHAKLLMGSAAVIVILAGVIALSPLGSLCRRASTPSTTRTARAPRSTPTRSPARASRRSSASARPAHPRIWRRTPTCAWAPRASSSWCSSRTATRAWCSTWAGLPSRFCSSLRRRSLTEILWSSVILISFVEMFVYDFLPVAIYVVMIACALLWRERLFQAQAAAVEAEPELMLPPVFQMAAPAR